ncbi:MAG: hypothetical protein ACE5GS_16570 [Kiloniellaceae bacterium]
MIVFCRGPHCAACAGYVRDLDRRRGEFDERSVHPVAVGGGTEERARESKGRWGIEGLTVGYGLGIATARCLRPRSTPCRSRGLIPASG